MFRHYKGLWLILALAFAVFLAVALWGPVTIAGHEFKASKLGEAFMVPDSESSAHPSLPADSLTASASGAREPVPTDTASKTILFIGDSMLEGLSPRLAAYARENGHTLYSVIWYSSTSEIWGNSTKIKSYINRVHPDYIFVCLGANELFVKDIKDKRLKFVKKMVADFGNIPFLWIGPPNWKPDTGINDLIRENVPAGSFFLSNGMHFERGKDGAHPTRSSASLWMDSVARWMPLHSNHPIRMKNPGEGSGKPARIFVHQPSER